MAQINHPGFVGGHTRVANWFIREVMATLTTSQSRVYLTIASLEGKHQDGREYALVSNARLAQRLGMSERQVQRITVALIALGLILRTNRPHNGAASEYVIVRRKPDVKHDTQDVVLPATPDVALLTSSTTSEAPDTPEKGDIQDVVPSRPMHVAASEWAPDNGHEDMVTIDLSRFRERRFAAPCRGASPLAIERTSA